MSLILEALKKLEREREAPGRGFLVVAHTPWGKGGGRAARLLLTAAAAGALAGAAGWAVWSALDARRPAAPGPAGAPAAAAAQPSALPPPIWEGAARPARIAPPSSPPAAAANAIPASLPPAADAAPAEPPLLVIAPPPAAVEVPLRLEAISVQEGEPVAVINGRLVRKGETVDAALVTWIGADAVEVEVSGRRRVLGF